MSTFGIRIKLLSRNAPLAGRLPQPVKAAIVYGAGAALFALALLARQLPDMRPEDFLVVFALCLAGMRVASIYLRRIATKDVAIEVSQRILGLTTLLALTGVVAGASQLPSGAQYGVVYLVLAPLLATGMLVSGLLGPVTAMLSVTLGTLAVAFAGISEATSLMGVWLASGVAAHAVDSMRQRNDLLRALYTTTGTFAVLACGLTLFDGGSLREAGLSAGFAALGGFGATSFFWLATVAFERAFGVVSDWTLLELCSPEHPLLHDLVLKAPGTYAHSVMVGNLAEQAAKAVGANSLLCRTLAYYHDVGKIKQPEFFIENKRAENPHDKLSPSLSAKIIGAHVRDGLELAEQHRLPRVLKDGIEQHHGTSLISYFYHMATKHGELRDPILEEHFRYSGPRPRTKETAILMLADRVEAAVRTLPRQTPGRLRTFVWEIMQDVRDDGQLDDSELNFRELQTIVASFVHTLSALSHERVEYPGVSLDASEEPTSYPSDERDRESREAGRFAPGPD